MQLPDVIPDDLTGIRNYEYSDLSVLFEDVSRFRRHTGWGVSCLMNPREQTFVFVFEKDSSFVNFEIALCRLYSNQRIALSTVEGRTRLAARVNSTPKEVSKDTPYTVLDRILNDNFQ